VAVVAIIGPKYGGGEPSCMAEAGEEAANARPTPTIADTEYFLMFHMFASPAGAVPLFVLTPD
jgi:hypothetical protein